jgi:hypothetical protein
VALAIPSQEGRCRLVAIVVFFSKACPTPAGRCLQPASIYAAHLHVCIPPGKRNITPSTQGEERGGQTPGGVRVGLDFFVTFCIKAKSTIEKCDTTSESLPFLRVTWVYKIYRIVSGKE